MKSYPSIPSSMGQSFREFEAYVYDKLDGSNLRFEWSRKRGWYKQGTRTRLFDRTDETFGPAIDVFENTLAVPLVEIAKGERWQTMVVFTEFWGEHSIGGLHDPDDEKQLTLFDVVANKRGFVSPQDFNKLFTHLNVAPFLGCFKWTRQFVQDVRTGLIEGVSFEGVVGKAGASPRRITAKAKTQAWVDAIIELHGYERAQKLINS